MFREAYFTEQDISVKSRQMYETAVKQVGLRPLDLEREKMAFVVIDMQEYFCRPCSHAFIPASAAIIGSIRKLQQVCIKQRIPVIFTRHINTSENARMLSTWWSDVITHDNPDSALSHKFDTGDSFIVEKTQYDAFYRTELEEILNRKGVHYVVFAGVMTNLCCETTVRSAFVRGFHPYLPIDLTATISELFHLSTVINLSYGFATPVLSGHILARLERC